ncbi:GHMP kinase [Candidatus Aerophobetes bacterium]|nr:GHMP kinase [Candidatus Aerophobetes bacterium]
MPVSVRVPGSCGELVQGKINGVNFHITCPVEIFSKVTVSLSDFSNPEKIRYPLTRRKAAKAVEKTLILLNGGIVPLKLCINSRIPVGKGMASSTADIVGTCLAVANFLGKSITPSQIARIASEIEPTDGTMYRGIVCFDHRRGILIEEIGNPPPMKVLVVDSGKKINTAVFNRRKDLDILCKVNEDLIKEAYLLVKEGIKKRIPELVGVGATISSLCNQVIIYKPELYKIISLSRKMGAFGVNVAHSGGVMGVLLPSDFYKFNQLEEKIKRECGSYLKFYRTVITEGGPRIE